MHRRTELDVQPKSIDLGSWMERSSAAPYGSRPAVQKQFVVAVADRLSCLEERSALFRLDPL
jgi:hypothetical protein